MGVNFNQKKFLIPLSHTLHSQTRLLRMRACAQRAGPSVLSAEAPSSPQNRRVVLEMNGFRSTVTSLAVTAASLVWLSSANAAPVNVVNASFEDDVPNFSEFEFSVPSGWSLFDPNAILTGENAVGTLNVAIHEQEALPGSAAPFAPGQVTGDSVAIISLVEPSTFDSGMVGISQSLGLNLAAHSDYVLTVDVGNVASFDETSDFPFDSDGFPGFRVQLVAGNEVIASTSEGTESALGEGLFDTVELLHSTGATAAGLGEELSIRLLNLNVTSETNNGGLDVAFDNVRFDATTETVVPLPAGVWLLASAVLLLGAKRRKRS